MLDGKEVIDNNPYAAIIEQVMALGKFPQAVGTLTYTSSLAAIMSTTDSLIIAISQLVTNDIIYPLMPNATPKEMGWATKLVALSSVSVSLVFGLFWSDGISALGAIQFSIQLMSVPAFFWGLYSSDRYDIHPWCMATSAITSTIYIVFIFFFHIKRNPNHKPIDSGMTGLTFQIGLIILLEALRRLRIKYFNRQNKQEVEVSEGVLLQFPGRPKWEIPKLARFGDTALTPKLLNQSMEGVSEPIRNLWCVFAFLFALTIVTPLVPGSMPPLSSDGTFANDYLPVVVNGLPWWAFKIILFNFVPYAMVFIVILRIPDHFSIDEKKFILEGGKNNSSIVNLTVKELANRDSYDSSNVLVQQRRSNISKCLSDISTMDQVEKNKSIEEKILPLGDQLRLRALIKEEDLAIDKVES